MLNFLRKHQRFFFLVVTVVIVFSFSFFGAFSAFQAPEKIVDQEVGKAVDGSSLMQQELEGLKRFLMTSREDRFAFESGRMPNLLNDGVIHKEFLKTGMASLFVKKHFEEMKEDLEIRVKKARYFKPYTHPQAAFLSAENVWKHFLPELSDHFTALKANLEEISFKHFELLAHLYRDQQHLPPDMLKQVLLYQQQQHTSLPADPSLAQQPFALFGFHSLEDWFGPKFLDLICRFIFDVSILAEQKGFKVSKEEAKADLLLNAKTAIEEFGAKDTSETALLHESLRQLGLEESLAVKLWRKVMLFRRFFEAAGNGVYLDPLPYEQFAAFSSEAVSVEKYQLPEELRFKDFRSLLKFQFYLEAVAPKSKNRSLALPKTFFSVEDVEKRFPELVQRTYEIEYSEAKKDQIALQISLKHTWDWELEDSGWELIKKQFPEISKQEAVTQVQRFEVLEKIAPELRLKIDQFARSKILEKHPEWLEEALQKAPVKQLKLSLRSARSRLPLDGLSDSHFLSELLQSASLKGDLEPSTNALQAQEKLKNLTEDGNHFYRIAVLKKSDAKVVMTFAEALREDVLGPLLDQRLEEAYPEIRKKDISFFQVKEGMWKPFKEVKDEVGALVYADLLRSIDEQRKKESSGLHSYPPYRFYAHINEMKQHLQSHPEDLSIIQKEERSLYSQWLLVKSSSEIKRSDHTLFSKEELFALKEKSWSSLYVPPNGDLVFFYIAEHKRSQEVPQDLLTEGQKMLSNEARCCLMQKVLTQLSPYPLVEPGAQENHMQGAKGNPKQAMPKAASPMQGNAADDFSSAPDQLKDRGKVGLLIQLEGRKNG